MGKYSKHMNQHWQDILNLYWEVSFDPEFHGRFGPQTGRFSNGKIEIMNFQIPNEDKLTMMQTKMFIFSIDIDHLFQRFFIFIKVVGQCVVRWMFPWVWIYKSLPVYRPYFRSVITSSLELSYYKSE